MLGAGYSIARRSSMPSRNIQCLVLDIPADDANREAAYCTRYITCIMPDALTCELCFMYQIDSPV